MVMLSVVHFCVAGALRLFPDVASDEGGHGSIVNDYAPDEARYRALAEDAQAKAIQVKSTEAQLIMRRIDTLLPSARRTRPRARTDGLAYFPQSLTSW